MKSNVNISYTEEDSSVLEQIDKITKLRVELAKQQSKIQSYKQLQQNWKNSGIKTEALYRQVLFFQRKLNDYNKKIIQITKMLNISNFQDYDQTPKFLDNSSQSFNSFQNNGYESTYKRNMTRLNSLRSIARFNSNTEEQQPQITDQQPKLNLILQSVIRLQKDNQQLQENLRMYEESCTHIQKISGQQKYLKEEFQNLIKHKDNQIQQKQLQIQNNLKQLRLKQQTIQGLEDVISQFTQKCNKLKVQNSCLTSKVNEYLETPSSELKRQEVKQKCESLLARLQVNDDQYLRSYLGNHRFKLDDLQTGSTRKTKYELIFD